VFVIDWYLDGYYGLLFSIVCPVHAYFVIKRHDSSIIRQWYSRWWGIPVIYLSILIPIFVVRSFLYEPFNIPAASMSPTLNPGDYIVVKKLGYGTYGTYGFSLLNTPVSDSRRMVRGKIYVFYPPHGDYPFVKRLIAIPGDTLRLDAERIVLNGKELEISFMYEVDSVRVYEEKLNGVAYEIQRMAYRQRLNVAEFVIPDGSYFFMGDNRDNSADSRSWGLVSTSRIIGEVVYVFATPQRDQDVHGQPVN
jgi:signal peptidase I